MPAQEAGLAASRPAWRWRARRCGAVAPSPIRVNAVAGLVKVFASQRTPVILLLDDWQWADDASRQVLTALRNDGAILTPSAQEVVLRDVPALSVFAAEA